MDSQLKCIDNNSLANLRDQVKPLNKRAVWENTRN